MLPNICHAILLAEGAVPLDFILMLFGFFLLAIFVMLVTIFIKHRRLKRLMDPNQDHYRKRN